MKKNKNKKNIYWTEKEEQIMNLLQSAVKDNNQKDITIYLNQINNKLKQIIESVINSKFYNLKNKCKSDKEEIINDVITHLIIKKLNKYQTNKSNWFNYLSTATFQHLYNNYAIQYNYHQIDNNTNKDIDIMNINNKSYSYTIDEENDEENWIEEKKEILINRLKKHIKKRKITIEFLNDNNDNKCETLNNQITILNKEIEDIEKIIYYISNFLHKITKIGAGDYCNANNINIKFFNQMLNANVAYNYTLEDNIKTAGFIDINSDYTANSRKHNKKKTNKYIVTF